MLFDSRNIGDIYCYGFVEICLWYKYVLVGGMNLDGVFCSWERGGLGLFDKYDFIKIVFYNYWVVYKF